MPLCCLSAHSQSQWGRSYRQSRLVEQLCGQSATQCSHQRINYPMSQTATSVGIVTFKENNKVQSGNSKTLLIFNTHLHLTHKVTVQDHPPPLPPAPKPRHQFRQVFQAEVIIVMHILLSAQLLQMQEQKDTYNSTARGDNSFSIAPGIHSATRHAQPQCPSYRGCSPPTRAPWL